MNGSSFAWLCCGSIRGAIGRLVVVALLSSVCASVRADEPPMLPDYEPQTWEPQVDIRYDGVLAESYGYHRAEKGVRNLLPERPAGYSVQKVPDPFSGAFSGGAYRYGFPVQTYRWGWFGAEHYYPYVVWHRGYNRDCVRWGYRRGY